MKKYKYTEFLSNTLPCLGYGVLMGIIAGSGVFFFKLAAEKLVHLSHGIYESAGKSILGILGIFASLTLIALVMSKLQQAAPEIRGGGIPRSEGIIRQRLKFKAPRTLVGTVTCALMSFFSGLPVGSEGPSVLIGCSIGRIFSPKKNREAHSRYVMTSGAAAGFSVATGAPLAAILFSLEEVHKKISPMLVLSASCAALTGGLVNNILASLFNVSPTLFQLPSIAAFEIRDILYIIILTLVISAAVTLFDIIVEFFDKFTDKINEKIPPILKLLFVFMLTGIVGIIVPDALFGGSSIITGLLDNNKTALFVGLMLLWRFSMLILISESGATGGSFVPTLAVGALIGALSAKLLIVLGMSEALYLPTVLISMCAFLGGVMRAPLTAIVFFVELTASGAGLVYAALAVFAVYLVTTLADRECFYEVMLTDMCDAQNKGKRRKIYRYEMTVSDDAYVVGKSVRDVLLPYDSIITAIIRADKGKRMLDNGGEKRLYAGDTIVLHVQLFDENEVLDNLYDLVGRDHEIKASEL